METLDSRLIRGAGTLWQTGTSARFLDAVADGSLPRDAFERWLVQDYHFAKGLVGFQGVLAAKTPRPAHTPVIAGLKAIDDELAWFEQHAAERGLQLDVEVHPTCRRYVDFLVACGYAQPLEIGLAVLYGVEVAYLAAWSALEPTGPYADFIEHWSNPGFRDYVVALQRIADDCAADAQQPWFDAVLRHEQNFWQMTWEG